jgi:transcriptional regulator with XRE-family HTH domain
MAATRNFADIIRKKLAADPALAEGVAQAAFEASVADQIYNARKEAGLTQAELAEKIGSQQSVIARMEDDDYDGHSVSMLNRIANALGKDLQVSFKSRQGVPIGESSGELPGVHWARSPKLDQLAASSQWLRPQTGLVFTGTSLMDFLKPLCKAQKGLVEQLPKVDDNPDIFQQSAAA